MKKPKTITEKRWAMLHNKAHLRGGDVAHLSRRGESRERFKTRVVWHVTPYRIVRVTLSYQVP